MKKILLAFVFLPMLSFAQDVNESPRKGIFDSSVIKESNDQAVFLDGQRVDKSIFTKMNPDNIKYVIVIKTNKNQYPNGKIEIILKKEKES
ncbi:MULTISPECIES: hypothetical protein [Empedobacter]|uniref:hypothetical protein n=1 Tax=Empedobacter TaxID=59734 RepID=UPI0025BA0AD5|nr:MULTISPECIES: hypothetical protein [unclassified Empedobacter]